jgi:Phosphoesterase family
MLGPPRRRRALTAVSAGIVALSVVLLPAAAASASSAGQSASAARGPGGQDGLGIKPGKIKHVWLIILENKSYDASFTGLNNNTYLWKTLPAQGVLLKNYYGTGHFSLDNYVSLVSGQATQPDTQADCPYYDQFSGTTDTKGSLWTNPDYGQLSSAQGPNAAAGSNGCVYPSSVPTLFNQLDASKVSWKGYAQDLGNTDTGSPAHDAGTQYCGAPYATPGATGSTAQPNPGSANLTDQYVPKHFPFPWFDSILTSGDCNSAHIANLFDSSNGLYHDLQSTATTPAFSWISPNNCSDAHDAVCHGNNLSGGFSSPTTANPPVNYTGGLYAADLFLEHVVPEIESSPAFKDGGLIDITFDEAFPPFTYTGNSFSNSTIVAPDAATSIASDTAGETLFGHRVHYEPTGPNTPLAKSASGQELYPGPGDNSFVDRPSNCVAQTVPSQPAGTCILGGGNPVPGVRTDAGAIAAAGSTVIADNSAVATDMGRTVTGTGIPAGALVGKVTDTPATPTVPNQSGGLADTGSFELVNASGQPLLTTGAVSGVTLGARSPSTDPLYDATDATNGGGDTGSVLISPYIKPGSVSTVYYNHYSWLRTMEDLFSVKHASPGLDLQGHIGYAAQPGLAPFGRDVFTNAGGSGYGHGREGRGLVAIPIAGGVAAALAVPLIGWRLRRRTAGAG